MPDSVEPAARDLASSALDAAGVADAHLAALREVFTDPQEYHAALAFARLHLPPRAAPGFTGQALWLLGTLLIEIDEVKPNLPLAMKVVAADALVRMAIAQLQVIAPPGGDRVQ